MRTYISIKSFLLVLLISCQTENPTPENTTTYVKYFGDGLESQAVDIVEDQSGLLWLLWNEDESGSSIVLQTDAFGNAIAERIMIPEMVATDLSVVNGSYYVLGNRINGDSSEIKLVSTTETISFSFPGAAETSAGGLFVDDQTINFTGSYKDASDISNMILLRVDQSSKGIVDTVQIEQGRDIEPGNQLVQDNGELVWPAVDQNSNRLGIYIDGKSPVVSWQVDVNFEIADFALASTDNGTEYSVTGSGPDQSAIYSYNRLTNQDRIRDLPTGEKGVSVNYDSSNQRIWLTTRSSDFYINSIFQLGGREGVESDGKILETQDNHYLIFGTTDLVGQELTVLIKTNLSGEILYE